MKPTAILGASPKPDRYSHMAQTRLMNAGHPVYPINPAYPEILGVPCLSDLSQLPPVDTLTVYIGPAHIKPLIPGILAAKPRRVVLNPGTENPELEQALTQAGIPWIHACTLVLLSTGQY